MNVPYIFAWMLGVFSISRRINKPEVTRKWLLGILPFFLFWAIFVPSVSAAWDNESYAYRKNITINETGAGALRDGYTVNITMDTRVGISNVSQADGDDVRIYFNGTEIDRWSDNWNQSNTLIEFKTQDSITTGNATAYKVYYGNSDVSNPPDNWTRIWYAGDNFESGDLDEWDNQSNAGVSINTTAYNGDFSVMLADGTATTYANKRFAPLNEDFAVSFYFRTQATATFCHFMLSRDLEAGSAPDPGYYFESDNIDQVRTWDGSFAEILNSTEFIDNSWYFFEILVDDQGASGVMDIWVNGTRQLTDRAPRETTGSTTTIQAFAIIQNSANVGTCNFDDLKIRYWVPTEPTTTLDSEEALPVISPISVDIISPANTTYTNRTISLDVSADASVDIWTYQFNGNGTNTTFTPNTTFYISGADGLKNITVWANNSNSTGVATQYFTFDTTPPIITINSPTNTTYTTTVIPLQVTANEVIDTWLYSLNGAANATFTPNTTTLTTSIGFQNITVWANDSAGLSNQTTTFFTVTIDANHLFYWCADNTSLGDTINITFTQAESNATICINSTNLNSESVAIKVRGLDGLIENETLNDVETIGGAGITNGPQGFDENFSTGASAELGDSGYIRLNYTIIKGANYQLEYSHKLDIESRIDIWSWDYADSSWEHIYLNTSTFSTNRSNITLPNNSTNTTNLQIRIALHNSGGTTLFYYETAIWQIDRGITNLSLNIDNDTTNEWNTIGKLNSTNSPIWATVTLTPGGFNVLNFTSYNAGIVELLGINYAPSPITLNFPPNNTETSNTTAIYSGTATDPDNGTLTYYLIVNGAVVESNTNGTFNRSTPAGISTWYINVSDGINANVTSEVRTLISSATVVTLLQLSNNTLISENMTVRIRTANFSIVATAIGNNVSFSNLGELIGTKLIIEASNSTSSYFTARILDLTYADGEDYVLYVVQNTDEFAQNTLKLQDLVGTFRNADFEAWGYVEDNFVQLVGNIFDSEYKISAYFDRNIRYTIYVRNDVETRTVGDFVPGIHGANKVITLGQVSFSPTATKMGDTVTYEYNNTANAIVFSWQDTTNGTAWVEFAVYNGSNTSQRIFFSNCTNTGICSFSYTVLNTNLTYTSIFTAYGTAWGHSPFTQLDIHEFLLGFGEFRMDLGLPEDKKYWYAIFSTALVIIFSMLFTRRHSALGGVTSMAAALFLAYIGWLPLPGLVVSVMMVMAVIYMITKRERVPP